MTTGDFILVVQFLFSEVWRFFNSWHFPGTNITPASWFFFSLVFLGVVYFLKRFLGGGGDSSAG